MIYMLSQPLDNHLYDIHAAQAKNIYSLTLGKRACPQEPASLHRDEPHRPQPRACYSCGEQQIKKKPNDEKSQTNLGAKLLA